MSASPSDCLTALEALSPVDGRYRAATAPLRSLLSEGGLIRERIRIEAQWLLQLVAAVPQLAGATLSPAVSERALELARAPEPAAATAVKSIENRINHDVKAVEYYVRERLTAAGASAATLELVHFGCTSEDINNLCYAVLLRAARADAATGLLDLKRLGDMLARIQGRITHRELDHVSPLAVPVMLEIGRESVYGEAADELLAEAADELVREAMQ